MCSIRNLALLSNYFYDINNTLKERNFGLCHIQEDWILNNFQLEDINFHKKYKVEYAREAILSGKDEPKILFNDNYICQSKFIQDLKEKRLILFGSSENIVSDPGNYHNIMLENCEKEVLKISCGFYEETLYILESWQLKFIETKNSEIECNKDNFSSLPSGIDELEIRKYFIQMIYGSLLVEKPCIKNYINQPENDFIYIPLNSNFSLILKPHITLSNNNISGSLGISFRIAPNRVVTDPLFNKKNFEFFFLQSIFLKNFSEYRYFSNLEEMQLNVLAWVTAIQIVLPYLKKLARHSL